MALSPLEVWALLNIAALVLLVFGITAFIVVKVEGQIAACNWGKSPGRGQTWVLPRGHMPESTRAARWQQSRISWTLSSTASVEGSKAQSGSEKAKLPCATTVLPFRYTTSPRLQAIADMLKRHGVSTSGEALLAYLRGPLNDLAVVLMEIFEAYFMTLLFLTFLMMSPQPAQSTTHKFNRRWEKMHHF